ncbi:1825_t:CDS:2 [Funneliformis caledonium]|uniref:1825_t:CDS:1 n=1 Tax=Funneliformis caledonium TaxID=1117310 RepID=A0A9N9IH46_9GLOM|nr:1825_t:CDS:2 [Funneliformis caledonium]
MDDIVPTQTNKKIVVGIVTITKDIQKITLHPTVELFKEHLESYIEKHSKGYIKDIGKHHWDSRFYSKFMTIVFPEVPEIKANAGIKIIEWKRNLWIAKAYTSLWKVDNTGLLTINTIIMKAMSREDKEERLKSQQIPTEDDDLKDDDRSNDYNGTVKEEISEENHYESENAMLFE